MNLENQKEYFDDFTSKMKSVMLKKGHDYSQDGRLSNFKRAGAVCGLDAKLNCLSLIATKVARLGVLLNSVYEPHNESIQDSVLDLANYSVLLSMILKDEQDGL